MRIAGVFVAIGILSTGCFGAEALSQVSSGSLGCSADEIVITNDDVGWGQRSWDASCRGRTYHCSGAGKGNIACTEDRPASPLVPVTAAETPKATPQPPKSHTWQRFAATECGVSVLLPGKPDEDHQSVRTKGGALASYSATVDLGTGSVFVGCVTLAKKPLAFDRVLDGARDGTLEELGADLEGEMDLHDADLPGREVRFKAGGDQHGRMRLLHHGRQVVTMGVVPTRALSNAETKAFFDSIAVEDAGDAAPSGTR